MVENGQGIEKGCWMKRDKGWKHEGDNKKEKKKANKRWEKEINV